MLLYQDPPMLGLWTINFQMGMSATAGLNPMVAASFTFIFTWLVGVPKHVEWLHVISLKQLGCYFFFQYLILLHAL